MNEGAETSLREATRALRGLIGDLVDRRMAERRGARSRVDVLQAIIDARHPVDRKGFTRDEMIDQVAVLFLAGHETSANSLTWTLFILSQQEEIAEVLRREANAAASGRWLTFEEVQRLRLTRQVVLESLRLYPPKKRNVTSRREPLCRSGGGHAPAPVGPWRSPRSCF
jgi:cytochrome P450